MKHLSIATLLAAALLFGCNQQKQTTDASQPSSKPAETHAQATSLTPEQLGELGAKIKKDPSQARELLSSHGLDDESFEKEIRKVTQDPVASRRYATAYKNAS